MKTGTLQPRTDGRLAAVSEATDGLLPPPGDSLGGSGRGPWEGDGEAVAAPWRLGVWLALAAVGMLFTGFTSGYLVRRTSADWTVTLAPPSGLWLNTALLVLSSGVLEWGRLRHRSGVQKALLAGLVGAAALGLAFVTGQVLLWRQLVARGVHLQSGPHMAYFYVLTGAHAVHVIIGLAWLAYAAWRLRAAGQGNAHLQGMAGAAVTFWHFMAGLWIYLFVLLFAV